MGNQGPEQLEVVPLVLIGFEVSEKIRLARAQHGPVWVAAYRWPRAWKEGPLSFVRRRVGRSPQGLARPRRRELGDLAQGHGASYSDPSARLKSCNADRWQSGCCCTWRGR